MEIVRWWCPESGASGDNDAVVQPKHASRVGRVRMNAVEKSIYMRLVGGGKVGKNEVGAQDALMPKNLEGWLVMHAG